MKNFLVLLLILVAAIVAYEWHRKEVDTAASDAAMRARAEAQPVSQPAPPPVHAVSISRSIEPLYAQLFADLDRNSPVDFVPPLELVRERILDQKGPANPGQQVVYDAGTKLVSGMIDTAEERTNALRAILEAASRPQASLDGKGALTSTNAFFAQTAIRRWDDEKRKRKPILDQLFGRLRNAEREWNQRLPSSAPADSYDPPSISAVLITVDPSTPAVSSLERGAHGRQRVVYPWRRTYYDQYGYPRTNP